jgi:predicted RecA/RadA family phage recombinase
MEVDMFLKLLSILTTTDLPATEDTRADLDYFELVNTNNDTIIFTADADYEAGDMILWGQYVGIVNADVLTGEEGSLRVKDGIKVSTDQVSAGTFAVEAGTVWFNAATGQITDTEAAGLYNIGQISHDGTMDADGVVKFYKRRYPIISTL